MRASYTVLTLFVLVMTGCAPHAPRSDSTPDWDRMREQTDRMQQQSALSRHHMNEPDLEAWYNQREQITQALGDRVFDKDFDRVFDSLTVGLASMGLTVGNMDRQSGYMSAHGQLLSPDTYKQLRSEEMVAWCKAKGYDPSLVERRDKDVIDPDMAGGMLARCFTALTVALVRQSEKQTKVKLRFNGIYYPRTLEESYRSVWPGIDKQIFIDKGTD